MDYIAFTSLAGLLAGAGLLAYAGGGVIQAIDKRRRRTTTEAPACAPEPPQDIAPVAQPKKPRQSPRKFSKPKTQRLMDQLLNACARGETNEQVASKLGCSPDMVHRCRNRSQCVKNQYWALIDGWRDRHPNADLRARIGTAHKGG